MVTGLGAPDDATNTDSLWAWQSVEGGIGHNNPLNTTYFMAGAVPWNTLPSGLHVWSYLTIEDGINATVVTLLNPDPAVGLPNGYDIIVDHLRRSVPRQQWQDACWQLDKWGTGCGWLDTYFGAAPGTLGEPLNPYMLAQLIYLAGLGRVYVGNEADWLIAEIQANPADFVGQTLGAVVNSAEGKAWAAKLAELRAGTLAGPPGPAGPPGATGPQGPAGPAGPKPTSAVIPGPVTVTLT